MPGLEPITTTVIAERFMSVMRRLGLTLLEPALTRWKGEAKADVRRYQALADAQTRLDVEAIERGEKLFDPRTRALVPVLRASDPGESGGLDRKLTTHELLKSVQLADNLRSLKSHLNVRAAVSRLRKKVPAPPRHGVGERLIRGHCSQRTNVSHSGASQFLFARRRASEGNRLAFSAPC